jgi:hypothetical protein
MASMSGAAEARRVAAHLARAEALAAAADVSRLDPPRRLARALLLAELRRYRAAGRFPRNPRGGAPTPIFVDAGGTRCAMAHLLELGGERALVARIRRERNLARVRELADEPRLRAWLAAAGLTLPEAAAIQPVYCGPAAPDCVCAGTTAADAIANRTLPMPPPSRRIPRRR